MTAPEPTDKEIAATLAARPAELWRELFWRVGALGELRKHVRWVTPRRLARNAFPVGRPSYSPALRVVHDLMYRLNVVVPYNWRAWHAAHPYPDGEGLADAPVAHAARLATAYLRAERFAEGTIGRALVDGSFAAIHRRLWVWYERESGLAGEP